MTDIHNNEVALEEWLTKVIDEVSDDESYDDDLVLSKINKFGSYLFSIEENLCDIDVVLSHLNESFSNTLDIGKMKESHYNVIEGLLVYSVTATSDSIIREKSIEVILSMNTNAQIILMDVVKSELNLYLLRNISNDQEISEVVPFEQDENKIQNLMKTNGNKCMNCEENIAIMNKFKNQVEIIKTEALNNETKLKSELYNEKHKLLDYDIILIDKEKNIDSLNKEIESLKNQILSYDNDLIDYNQLSIKIHSLQDTIDILQPKANRLDIVEEQLIQLKDKLDEYKLYKSQLQLETNNHIDTYNKLIELQNDYDNIVKINKELYNYKEQYTEIQIQMNELNIIINNKNNIINELKNKNNILENNQIIINKEKNDLSKELNLTNNELLNQSISMNNGIGNGINEFNPNIINELNNIKNENKNLKNSINILQLNNINELNNNINNLTNINNSLQLKIINYKNNINNYIIQYNELQLQYNNISNEYKNYQLQQNEINLFYNEEIFMIKLNNNNCINILTKKYNDLIKLYELGKSVIIKQLSNEINEKNILINNKENELNNQIILYNNILNELNILKNELNNEINKSDINELKHNNIINELNIKYENDKKLIINDNNEKINEINKYYNELLSNESNKYMELQLSYDNEIIKRRRLDKEKKLLEIDINKYKTQLYMNINNNSNESNDHNDLLNEFKQMQNDIEKYQNDINILKTIQNTKYNENMNSSNNINVVNDNKTSSILSKPQRLNNNNNNLVSNNNNTITNSSYMNYIELNEINERKLQTLTKEKREILAKNLQINKEKNELLQKNLLYEQEINTLKSKIIKVTLDKERIERKYNILE